MKPSSITILLIISILTASIPIARAQDRVRYPMLWGGTMDEEAHSIAADTAGNLYLTGSTQSFSTGNGCGSNPCTSVFVLKVALGGGRPWQRIWGGNDGDTGESVAVDSSGNVYLTGTTGIYGAGASSTEVFLLKFDTNGTLTWQITWGGSLYDNGEGVAVDPAGYIYVTGVTSSFGFSPGQPFLLKFKPNGALVWQEAWDQPWSQPSGAHGISVDSSGNIYVVGYTGTFIASGTSFGPLVLKYDSEGHVLWARALTTSGGMRALGVASDQSGNVYVTGSVDGFGANIPGIFLMRLDSFGRSAWIRTWGNTGSVGRSISLDAEGNICVVGSENLGSGRIDVSLSKLDPQGNLLWERIWGGTKDDEGFGGAVAFTGDVYVTGYVSEAPPYDYSAADTVTTTPTFTASALNASTSALEGNVSYPKANISVPQGLTSGNVTYAGGKDVFLAIHDSSPSYLAPQGLMNMLVPSLLIGTFLVATVLVSLRIRRSAHA